MAVVRVLSHSFSSFGLVSTAPLAEGHGFVASSLCKLNLSTNIL